MAPMLVATEQTLFVQWNDGAMYCENKCAWRSIKADEALRAMFSCTVMCLMSYVLVFVSGLTVIAGTVSNAVY